MPNLFIIIVTFNGVNWLDKCLESCSNYPVIIVDNASTDETVFFIETNYPKVKLLKQPENLGFGQANNIGIRYALDQDAEHVFLLNQDAYLVDNVLEELMTFQKQHPKYGILSPIHITGDKKRLDKNFSIFMRQENSGQFYSDFVLGNTLAIVYQVPFVNAAAWLISRKCLETVGGFDPLFFHYGEDENYCQRVLFHDLKIGVLPRYYVIHDRQHRKRPQIKPFNDLYFQTAMIRYKTILANILTTNAINVKKMQLKRMILKSLIQLRFKRVFGVKKELNLLHKLIPQINESRNRNSIKGNHYL